MKRWRFSHAGLLFLVAAITYLPFFWERGFYWDEAPWSWIYFRLGPDALTRTFSTSRPFWGMLYQLTLPIGGANPWVWQLSMTFTRALTAYLLYLLLKLFWKNDGAIPVSASLLFLVYPGLSQNFLGLMYTHFYIVLSLFLSSFLLTAKATHGKRLWFHIPALALAIANILMIEYFYFLELFRPIFIWAILGGKKENIKPAATHATPYILSFIGVSAWRIFFFTNQNASYTYGTLDALHANPITGILQLLKMMAISFWNTAILVWVRGFEILEIKSTGLFTFTGALVIALILVLLLIFARHKTLDEKPDWYAYSATFLIWVLSGGAFWLVGARTLPELHFSADRFTMPFMVGASLLLALLLSNIRPERIRNVLLIATIALAGAWQFSTGRAYAQDRIDHDRFFSQLIGRVPSIAENTLIITNDLPLTYYSDNSLSGTLNWIYSEPGKMQTILYYASVRGEEGRALAGGFEPNQPIEQNYLARVFYGNSSDTLVFEYSPPGCLRLLDPQIDPVNKLLPPDLRDAAKLSDPKRISSLEKFVLPPHLVLRENQWCDAYEKASLSAYDGDWENVVEIFKLSQESGLNPQAPMENLIFIEAFANIGNFEHALALSNEVRSYSKNYTTPPLCALWQRIESETNPIEHESTKILNVMELLDCGNN